MLDSEAVMIPVIDPALPDTHAFISFRFHADRLPARTWTLLGEASSKIEHVCGVPLRPKTARTLYSVFLTKGVHGTTAIEGNTLSEDEVAQRLEGRLQLPESQEYLGKEVDNIVRAYNSIIDLIRGGAPPRIAPEDLRRFNTMVLEGLELPDEVMPGKFREHVVGVADYRSPPPEHSEALLQRLCEWLNGDAWNENVGARFVLPVLKSIIAHLYIAWIHPFGDGNGRTARLVEFDILTRAGVPPISAHVMADHYNRTRVSYYRALSRARRDPAEFVMYAVSGLVEGLRAQLKMVWADQVNVAWINYVHEVFNQEPGTNASRRRRQLAIALSSRPEPVPRREIRTLTAEIAAAYGDRTRKAVSRDLNHLERLNLVVKKDGGFRAKLEEILAFLPERHPAAGLDVPWPPELLPR